MGILPVSYVYSNKDSFVSVGFHGDHMTYKGEVNYGHPQFWGYCWIFICLYAPQCARSLEEKAVFL